MKDAVSIALFVLAVGAAAMWFDSGVVLNFMHPETRSADGKHPLLHHTPVIPEGAVIEGDDFPIVYDESVM